MAKTSAGRFGILRDVADSLSDEDGFQVSGKQSKSSGADQGTKTPGKSTAKNAKKRAKKRAAKAEVGGLRCEFALHTFLLWNM